MSLSFLWLELFDALVSPAMLFGREIFRIDEGAKTWCRATANVSVYSWVGPIYDGLSWRDTTVQMNHALAIAKTLFPMDGWGQHFAELAGVTFLILSDVGKHCNFYARHACCPMRQIFSCEPFFIASNSEGDSSIESFVFHFKAPHQ